jgi:hypothetical protein
MGETTTVIFRRVYICINLFDSILDASSLRLLTYFLIIVRVFISHKSITIK